MMSRNSLVVGVVLAVAVLAIGAVALWVLPDRAEARSGSGGGCATCGTDQGAAATDGTVGGYRGCLGNVESGTPRRGNRGGMQGNAGLAGTCASYSDGSVGSGSLTETEVSALTAALEDEHKAKALYEQAIADLGSVRPFTQIVRAEEHHIAALESLFTRYGLEVPATSGSVEGVPFSSLAAACAAGVTAEKANVALYDGLFPQVENSDVTRMFTALQSASQNRHLPALEACAP